MRRVVLALLMAVLIAAAVAERVDGDEARHQRRAKLDATSWISRLILQSRGI